MRSGNRMPYLPSLERIAYRRHTICSRGRGSAYPICPPYRPLANAAWGGIPPRVLKSTPYESGVIKALLSFTRLPPSSKGTRERVSPLRSLVTGQKGRHLLRSADVCAQNQGQFPPRAALDFPGRPLYNRAWDKRTPVSQPKENQDGTKV